MGDGDVSLDEVLDDGHQFEIIRINFAHMYPNRKLVYVSEAQTDAIIKAKMRGFETQIV